MKGRVTLLAVGMLLAAPRAFAQAGGVSDGNCHPEPAAPGSIGDIAAVVSAAQAIAADAGPYDITRDPLWADTKKRMAENMSLPRIDELARNHRKKLLAGAVAPDEWDVHWAFGAIANEVLAEKARADGRADRVKGFGNDQLLQGNAMYEAELDPADPARRARSLSRYAKERILTAEIVRQEIERRLKDKVQSNYGDLAPEIDTVVLSAIAKTKEPGFDLEKGFTQDLGHGWEAEMLAPGLKAPKFLVFKHKEEPGKAEDKIVIVSLEAKPKVLRFDFRGDIAKGGVDVLAAKGAFNVTSGGVDVEAAAYAVAGDIGTADGFLAVKGYAGGIGIKLKVKDGKIAVGAVPGIGASVEIDFTKWPGVSPSLRPAWLNEQGPPVNIPSIFYSGTAWVDDKRNPDGGYYVAPGGTRISKAAYPIWLSRAR